MNRIYNLSIPGIDKELFSHPFYLNKCRKINFNGVIHESEFVTDNGADYISLAPKFKPHSDYEMMLQSTDSVVKSPITSLSDEAINHIFGTGYNFINYWSNPDNILKYDMDGGYAYLVFNYDEFTTDRHSGMSKKPFHLHLNSWKKDTIGRISEIDQESANKYYLESVVDPIFDLTRVLARDALDCPELAKYLEVANPICGDQKIDYSAVYRLRGGWSFLNSPEFPKMMKLIHNRLEKRYKEILHCFCGTIEMPREYTRHLLFDRDTIEKNILCADFQDSTKVALFQLIDRVQSITPEQFAEISKNTDLRDSIIPLRWLAYSVGFFSNEYLSSDSKLVESDAYMNCTPRLFTKIGGASIMNFPEHSLVKIDRGQGNISEDEFEHRVDMHKDFVKTLKLGDKERWS